jgi:phosphotransferase system  glucose/maltose/N-acetylglucosamine-specific IIC component
MQTLSFIHERLSVTILLFVLALGIWGFWNFLRGEGVTGSYWGALAIAVGLLVIEGLIGVVLYVQGARPSRGILHILYGIVSVLAFPAAFTFTRGRTTRYESLIYAVVALFLAGITLRAQTTGG